MKISKKAPLMAFVLGLGLVIGFSAFTNAEPGNSNQAEKIYYHVGNQFVDTQPSGTTCQEDVDYSCRIKFTGTDLPTVSSFPEGSTPTSPSYSSAPDGTLNWSYQE